MSYDLRKWINQFDNIGEIKHIANADWDQEIGAISAMLLSQGDSPALLFDDIKGYAKGYRILASALGTPSRLAKTLGLPSSDSSSYLGLIRQWSERLKVVSPLPYKVVSNGAVLENIHLDSEINLFEFPAPFWHEHDGGRYLGTACMVITKDPDDGTINIGTYRVMVHDNNTLGFFISPGKHGRLHREKYFARGQSCPVAICFGQHPLLYLGASIEVPFGVCEYDYIGGITGIPVEVINGPVTGLPIPANAEIVIEGESLPGDDLIEGPFGEWTGYYGSSSRPEPVIRVKSVLHRNNPIISGAPPTKPPSEQTIFKSIISSGLIWEELEKAGVPGIRGVWRDTRFWVVVSVKQQYPGHSKQAALIASQCHSGAYLGRYVIVVDEDIDPTNTKEVLWALMTRTDPANSIDIIRRCWSGPLDPIIPRDQKGFNSRAIIDACKPYEWKNDFPKSVEPSLERMESIRKKWSELFTR